MGCLLLAALLPLDLAVPARDLGLPWTHPGRLSLALRVEERAGEARLAFVHANTGGTTIEVVAEDCDGLTHFVQLDGVEYPVPPPGGCRPATRRLAPGESFTTTALLSEVLRVHAERTHADAWLRHHSSCHERRASASYRANAYGRPERTWSGALDTAPVPLRFGCAR